MKSRGFTLIELLISISLVSLISVYVFYLFFSGIKSYEKISRSTHRGKVVIFVINKLTDDILESRGIGLESDENKLVLKGDEGDIIYEYKNKKVKRQKGITTTYLTIEDDIQVLKFNYDSNKVRVTLGTNNNYYMFSVYPRNL